MSNQNIYCHHIYKSFGDKSVFKNADFVFEQGINCLFGKSGKGKTTLLRMIAGLDKPDSGNIIGVTNQKVSYVFQEDRLLPWKTAFENIALVHGTLEAEKWLTAFDMIDATRLYPKEMSGGMNRRVTLARGLAGEYHILLLDEPSKGLDPALKETFYQLLEEHTKNIICILVTHDVKEANRLANTFVEI